MTDNYGLTEYDAQLAYIAMLGTTVIGGAALAIIAWLLNRRVQ